MRFDSVEVRPHEGFSLQSILLDYTMSLASTRAISLDYLSQISFASALKKKRKPNKETRARYFHVLSFQNRGFQRAQNLFPLGKRRQTEK